MELEIRTTALEAAATLGRKAGEVERAAQKGVRAAGKAVYDIDRKEVNVIYARPIPRGKGKRLKGGKRGPKKAMWKRKGTLRRGELLSFPNPFTGLITNDTPYALARHELNRPGAGGVTRHDPWRRNTAEKAEQAVQDAFQKAFEAALSK